MNMKYALRSEDTEQINVIQWAQYQIPHHPELKLLHHCPNGGSRNKAEAVKLKQMGVRAGVPDLHLPVPKGVYSGLYIEMKYGNYCAVCYGAEEAINIIAQYINLKKLDTGKSENKMQIRNGCILKEGRVKSL